MDQYFVQATALGFNVYFPKDGTAQSSFLLKILPVLLVLKKIGGNCTIMPPALARCSIALLNRGTRLPADLRLHRFQYRRNASGNHEIDNSVVRVAAMDFSVKLKLSI